MAHWVFGLVSIATLSPSASSSDQALADYVSAFPSGMNVAATWSRDLARARGEAIGAENKAKGVDTTLGPVCGPLGRAPEGGRNWVSSADT